MSSCLSCCPRRTQILSWDFLWIAIYSNESMLQAIVQIVQDGLVFNHYQTLDIVNLHWPYWINRSSLITFQLTRGVEVSHILWEVKSPSSRQVLNKMLNSLRQPTCLWVHQQVSFPFSKSLSRCEVHLLTALVTHFESTSLEFMVKVYGFDLSLWSMFLRLNYSHNSPLVRNK